MELVKRFYTKVVQVISTIFHSLLMVFIALSIFSIGLSIAQGEELTFYGYKPFYVRTGSMEPEMRVQSVVIVKAISDNDTIEKGDIVTYEHEDVNVAANTVELKTITHRVVSVDEKAGTFKAKGDGSNHIDSFVLPDQSVTENLDLNKIQYKHKYTMNWVATAIDKSIEVMNNKPLAISFGLMAVAGIGLIYYINKELYKVEYEFKLLKLRKSQDEEPEDEPSAIV